MSSGINKNNIDNEFGEIVLYYADWCSYSNKMLPEWAKFEEYAKINFKKLGIKKINCDHEIIVNNEILSYPTIILFSDNKKKEYNGDRSLNSFIKFIGSNGYDQFKELENESEKEIKKTLIGLCYSILDIILNNSAKVEKNHIEELKGYIESVIIWTFVKEKISMSEYKQKIDEINKKYDDLVKTYTHIQIKEDNIKEDNIEDEIKINIEI